MVAQRTAKRMLLGRELQHLMTAADKTQTEVAGLLEIRQSRVADWVSGSGTMTRSELERLAAHLGATDEGYMEELLELRRGNHKRGFWTTGHRRAYREDFRLMVDLERHADLIRSVECEAVPGLLQCEAYVRAQFSWRPSQGGVPAEDMIEARLARQQPVLDGSLEYRAVMSESCLRRQFGGPEAMREQIDHLMTLSMRPNVLLQAIPFNVYQGLPVNLIPFAAVQVPSRGRAAPLQLVYVEGIGEIRYLDDPKALAAYDRGWAHLSSVAMSPDDTRQFMKHVDRTLR